MRVLNPHKENDAKITGPSVKLLSPGLEYHEFRTEYQKHLGNRIVPRSFFHQQYGYYVLYHRKKS